MEQKDTLFNIDSSGNILLPEDLEEQRDSEKFKISRCHATGDYKFKKSEIVINGKKKMISTITVNSGKVEDATTTLLQKGYQTAFNFDYYQLNKEAEKKLKPFFIEHDLIEKEENSDIVNEKIKRWRKIKIDNTIHEIIKSKIRDQNKATVSIEAFAKALNIKSLYTQKGKIKISRLLDVIYAAQDNSVRESSVSNIVFDEKKQSLIEVTTLARTYLIPKIEFVLDADSGITSIEELKTAKIQNKEKHIKAVKITFDLDDYVRVVVPISNYINLNRVERANFKNKFSKAFDSYIRALYDIQRYGNKKHHYFPEFQEKWNLNYTRYSNFKVSVLTPVIQDFNKYSSDMEVILEEHIEKKKMKYFTFRIKRKGELLRIEERKYENLAYYIALQHTLTNNYLDQRRENEKIDNFKNHIENLKNWIEEQKNNDDIKYCESCPNDKTLHSWKLEHKKEKDDFENLLGIYEKDKEWFDERNIDLSLDKLCFVDKKTKEIKTIMRGQVLLHKPSICLEYYQETKNK